MDNIINEVIRTSEQSKKVGSYQTKNYFNNSYLYSNDAGHNNIYSLGINPQLVDADSYLKNTHIKLNNTVKLNNNPLVQKSIPISNVNGNLIRDTRVKKSCDEWAWKDLYKMGYRTNEGVKGAQDHIDYDIRFGIDSRHLKR